MFRRRTGILLLICIGLLLYVNSLTNAFISDDRNQILTNPAVHSLSSIPNFFFGSTYYSGGAKELGGLYYRPLMMTFYTLVYFFSGENPLLFHVLQVFLHIGNAILVFILFELFFPELPAFLLALFFLIHPINTEAVVYIADLQDVLFVFFGLLATVILFYKKNNIAKWNIQIAIGICLLLSLLSKETGIVFFAAIIVYLIVFNIKQKKHIFISLLGSFFTYIFCRFFLAHIGISKGIVLAPIATASLQTRLLNIPYIFSTYMSRFFFPLNLSSSDYSIVSSFSLVDFFVPFLISLGLIGIIVLAGKWIAKKHKKYIPQFLFFTGWFFIGIIPHLQFIPLDQTIAERWFYFSSIGILGVIGIIVSIVKIKQQLAIKAFYAIVGGILILFSIRTVIRNANWKNGITLYTHDTKTTKESFLLDNALATELIIDGQYQHAKPYVFASIRSYPFYANLNNAAVISLSEKNIPQTKHYLQQALKHNANYAVYENYSNFLLVYGTTQETRDFTKAALVKYPNDPKILFDFGKAAWSLGDTQPALLALKKAYSIEQNVKTKNLIEEITKTLPNL